MGLYGLPLIATEKPGSLGGPRRSGSKPSGDQGTQSRKYSVHNSRVVQVSAYASRAKPEYRDQRFAHLSQLSSHDRRERRVYINGSRSHAEYFCSHLWGNFVSMAIDYHLMLVSEVDTITTTRHSKGILVDSEAR